MSRPTDLATLLVMALAGHDLTADEIAHRLCSIGVNANAQKVGAWMRRLLAEECPCVRSVGHVGWLGYGLTRFGWTVLGNQWPALRAVERRHS